jgi:2-C-methyl-D-erythritol 4-phosphate cytidylyltransferase
MATMAEGSGCPEGVARISDVRAGIARAERERCIALVIETARGFARAAERYPPGSALSDDLLRKSAAASAVALALKRSS